MKDHFCSIEKEWIGYEVQCNWCGEKENTQQRIWFGLNWSDVPDEWIGKPAFMEGAKWAEAKLREKNT
jgi:hypothetical protein